MQVRKLLYKTDENIQDIAYAHEDDAACDIRIKETVTLKPLERTIAGTGLYIALPDGCVGLLAPRSGVATKRGISLINTPGIIDHGYRGEVGVGLVNISNETVTLEAGERVCQLMVVPVVPCNLVKVDELDSTERGANGFGSTDTK